MAQIRPAPPELEDGGQATVDDLLEVNMGTPDHPRPTFISSHLDSEERDELIDLLRKSVDCFAWSYSEMPGLDPSIAAHKLAIAGDKKPVKQTPRNMRIEVEKAVNKEVKKLIDANFIREEQYPEWISSVVPVKKKNGDICICIDFRDLNKACPKDDFPLPTMEIMIDNTSTYEAFSFMDGYSGYNQIRMAPEDEKHTAFRTPMGVLLPSHAVRPQECRRDISTSNDSHIQRSAA